MLRIIYKFGKKGSSIDTLKMKCVQFGYWVHSITYTFKVLCPHTYPGLIDADSLSCNPTLEVS